MIIIVDGLDECGQEEKISMIMWFKTAIETAADENPGKVRCLFVSQDDGDIRKLLTTVPEIQVRPEDNKRDIEAYVSYKAIDIQKKFDLPDSKREEIVAKVGKRAEGWSILCQRRGKLRCSVTRHVPIREISDVEFVQPNFSKQNE